MHRRYWPKGVLKDAAPGPSHTQEVHRILPQGLCIGKEYIEDSIEFNVFISSEFVLLLFFWGLGTMAEDKAGSRGGKGKGRVLAYSNVFLTYLSIFHSIVMRFSRPPAHSQLPLHSQPCPHPLCPILNCNMSIHGCPRTCSYTSWRNFSNIGSPANLIIIARTASKLWARSLSQSTNIVDLDLISWIICLEKENLGQNVICICVHYIN